MDLFMLPATSPPTFWPDLGSPAFWASVCWTSCTLATTAWASSLTELSGTSLAYKCCEFGRCLACTNVHVYNIVNLIYYGGCTCTSARYGFILKVASRSQLTLGQQWLKMNLAWLRQISIMKSSLKELNTSQENPANVYLGIEVVLLSVTDKSVLAANGTNAVVSYSNIFQYDREYVKIIFKCFWVEGLIHEEPLFWDVSFLFEI